MKLLDVVHPAAKTLVDIAKSQDAEVGDGTTSVVILAGEFLKQFKPFVEEGVHPRVIIKSVRKATALALAQSVYRSSSLTPKKSAPKNKNVSTLPSLITDPGRLFIFENFPPWVALIPYRSLIFFEDLVPRVVN